MKLTFEKKTTDQSAESSYDTFIKSIKEELGRQNNIDSELIGFHPDPNQTLDRFFRSFIGPGDEALTIGPTNEKICRAITSCDASYFEFYEKPLFLPDSLGLVGKITTHTKLIILGNPNRFTGVVYSQKEIENILNISKDIIVILDESTFESSRITAFELLDKYDNLALVRSFENDNNSQLEYIISNPNIIKNIDNCIFEQSIDKPALSNILYNLKNPGNRMGRIKDARQEMLYLSIRLRMFGVGCFLNPDYSLVINTIESEESLFLLNETGIKAKDLACFPGLGGNILVPFQLDVNAMSIVDIFENKMITKNYKRPNHNRLKIYRSSETDSGLKIGENQYIESGSRLESNMVF